MAIWKTGAIRDAVVIHGYTDAGIRMLALSGIKLGLCSLRD